MMYCMFDGCDGETKVMETRGSIRRRKCLTCRRTFYTEEVSFRPKRGEKSPFTIKHYDYEKTQ